MDAAVILYSFSVIAIKSNKQEFGRQALFSILYAA